jgi:hypothetical protein
MLTCHARHNAISLLLCSEDVSDLALAQDLVSSLTGSSMDDL